MSTASPVIGNHKHFKMDIRMSSLPVGGPMGGVGANGYFMGKRVNQQVGPQVTLNLSVHPPVLDTAGSKPASLKSSSNSCGGSRRFGGHWWTSLRNMYNSIKCSSGTPVTWVNPDMVPQFQPLAMAQSFYPKAPYPVVETSTAGNQNSPLWYQAAPGSYCDYLDPVQALASQYYNSMGSPAYPGNFIPDHKNGLLKSSRPLNPEAKEWVPSNFRNNRDVTSSVPKCSLYSPDKNVQNPMVITPNLSDFVEITDHEINEVRKNMENEAPKKSQDDIYHTLETKNINIDTLHKSDMINAVAKQSEDSYKDAEEFIPDNANGIFSTMTSINDNQDKVMECDSKFIDLEQSKSNLTLSYASIARKSPEPLLKPNFETPLEKDHSPSPCELVKQPLPKVFIKDKKYPKEKAAPLMENGQREPLPFKTASKTQKKSSRKFLKDLRDLSPAKSDCSFSGSEGSLESSSEIMSRLCIGNSPSSLRLSASTCILPKVSFTNAPSKNVKSQRSASESSGGSSYQRTTSESSTGSVDSVDIEFNDDCDITEDKVENVCVVTETCKTKHQNSILSHILGLEDSDSEDSDDESSDDDDWDEVGECDTIVLDDSWETFGLAIPLITNKSVPPHSKSCSDDNDHLDHSENICDNDYFNSNIEDVNKQWEEEITKDVVGASPSRVRFGKASVHPMITWSYAYKNARRGPWEQYARDRARFKNRIAALEPVISTVLKGCHREAMYRNIYGC